MLGGGRITIRRSGPTVARQKRGATVAVDDIRALQVAKFQARLARLPGSTDVYDFDRSGERALLQRRIAQLEVGEVVHLQTWELADELKAVVWARWRRTLGTPKCFRIEGNELIPEDYERVANG
jgi:hypothetical protein